MIKIDIKKAYDSSRMSRFNLMSRDGTYFNPIVDKPNRSRKPQVMCQMTENRINIKITQVNKLQAIKYKNDSTIRYK